MEKNSLVQLLASYGPHPNANNLFDEFVSKTADEIGCKPLRIKQPLIETLENNFKSPDPMSIILTGTAGDGKTYIARNLAQNLSGKNNVWDTTEQEVTITLPGQDGRKITFIKDLSQLASSDLEKYRTPILDALLGKNDELYVLCVNDGFLLSFFREEKDEAQELYDVLVKMLQDEKINDSYEKFNFYNLSIGSHLKILDDIIDSIVKHEDWKKCENCSAFKSTDAHCPIRHNLEVLRLKETKSMRARLKDLIQISAANGNHLSIRHIILLIVNTLLGDGQERKVLLNCKTAKLRANEGHYNKTNPYANVFGDNLSKSQRVQYLVFDVFRKFGIGKETNNYFDNELLLEENLFPQHEVYGSKIFSDIRELYLANPQENAKEYIDAVVQQRRRVFFTSETSSLQKQNLNGSDPWNLSEFKHGGQYINLVESLATDQTVDTTAIKQNLLNGLNRMMSGLMADPDGRLWLIEPVGVFQGSEIPMVIEFTGPETDFDTRTYLKFKTQRDELKIPILSVIPNNKTEYAVDLVLKPTLVECLLRIADGAIPSSFSNECSQEIRRFQLKVIKNIEKAFAGKGLYKSEVKLVAGKLQKEEIEYLKSIRGEL